MDRAVAGFAALARRVRPESLDDYAVGTGLGAHLAFALLHALVIDAPPEAVQAGDASAIAGASSPRSPPRA